MNSMTMSGLINILLVAAFLLPYALAQTPQGENTSVAILQCDQIQSMPICEEMPWDYALFPNLRDHESQEEANSELEQFRSLIELNCSGAIVHFLCSIYAPFCSTDINPPKVIRPCRSLCQYVRDGCEQPFLERAGGLPWPEHLICENYDDNVHCFGPDPETLPALRIPTTLIPSISMPTSPGNNGRTTILHVANDNTPESLSSKNAGPEALLL